MIRQIRYPSIQIRQYWIYLIVFIVYALYCNSIQASNADSINSENNGLIKVLYERTMVLDTINPANNSFKETLTLKTNLQLSVFYSELKWEEVQKIVSDSDYCMKLLREPKRCHSVGELDGEIIFRDYRKNKSVEQQRYDLTNWKLVEEMEKPEWDITDSICTVAGYPCIMATTKFRGRRWTAFFAPDIPIPEGPWKLWGLPGIILKAYDSKMHYSFTATDIITQNIGPIRYFENRSPVLIKDRIKGLQYRWKCLKEDIRKKIVAMYGVAANNLDKFKSSPTNYDFEETDYPHE